MKTKHRRIVKSLIHMSIFYVPFYGLIIWGTGSWWSLLILLPLPAFGGLLYFVDKLEKWSPGSKYDID